MASILHHLLPGHVTDKVQFSLHQERFNQKSRIMRQWSLDLFLGIRPYGILGLGKAVHGRMMCLHQVLGLRSAGPVLELCAKENQWLVELTRMS